jgi:hypothetical protein
MPDLILSLNIATAFLTDQTEDSQIVFDYQKNIEAFLSLALPVGGPSPLGCINSFIAVGYSQTFAG